MMASTNKNEIIENQLYASALYLQEISKAADACIEWEKLSGKSLAVSGGTGMIGSFLIDVIMYRNERFCQESNIYVLGRNEQKAASRFGIYKDSRYFHFIEQDINKQITGICGGKGIEHIDYVIHAASNTHPVAYSSDPIGTISANVIGTNNMLEWASRLSCERFVFFSSVEIYGENRGDTDKFSEDYLGYIDCNTMRAGYPESKRTGEALCQAYIRQKGLNVVIPRLSRVYGPTMLMSDTKALSQFILKSVNGEDIVLKSSGTQEFSYSYVADAVTAILKIMLDGECGAAYNTASDNSDIMLKDLAKILAEYSGRKVVFELPDEAEASGYSKATKATLDVTKLKRLGWTSAYDIEAGLRSTVDILREI